MNVVLGAGSGMGEAVAREISDRGDLLLVDKDGAAVADLAHALGSHVEAMVCDITVERDRAAVVARIDELDALVVTAGLSPGMGTGRTILDVNLRGMAMLLHALDGVVGRRTAAVLFASIAGHRLGASPEVAAVLDDATAPDLYERLVAAGADPEVNAYRLSKGGVMRLARRLALRWGPRGARVVSVSPGIVDTPMGQFEIERHTVEMQQMISQASLGRVGHPRELAAVAAFLCSPSASFVTGCDVLVDGGWSAAALG